MSSVSRCVAVSTLLSLDGCTTNLLEVGHPILVTLSNHLEWKPKTKESESTVTSLNTLSSQNGTLRGDSTPKITAKTVGKETGNTLTHVEWSPDNNATPTVNCKVQPLLYQPDDYTLEILYQGDHVRGSPFIIKALTRGSLSSKSVTAVVEEGEAMNLIMPVVSGAEREVGVSVQGPLGPCDVSIATECDSGSLAVNFTPQVFGDYNITMGTKGGHVTDYIIHIEWSSNTCDMGASILAEKSPSCDENEEAQKCHIVEEDRHIFEKPQRLRKKPITFCISTKDVLIKGKLDVKCNGPGPVAVEIVEESVSRKRCHVTCTVPGTYNVDILWNDRHIRGSPFNLVYKQPTKRQSRMFVSDGLNFKNESLRIGVPYRFKLNCSEVGEGEVQISSQPPSAASVSITPVPPSSGVYRCEIIPREIGEHEVSLIYRGKHIGESPFKVYYNPPGDASQCNMVGSCSNAHIGGNVTIQISTAGAGRGSIQAGVEDIRTHQTIPVYVRKTASDLYQLQFQPSPHSNCLLAVKYDYQHIQGSPFKLSFEKQGKCRAKGEGLVSARAGEWNRFTVCMDSVCLGCGALWVNIEGAGGGEVVTPAVCNITPTQFEVSYMPQYPGNYTISVRLGTTSVPGSPFKVRCYGAATGSLRNRQLLDTSGERKENNRGCDVIAPTKDRGPNYGWREESSQDNTRLTRKREVVSQTKNIHLKEGVTFL